MKIYSHHFDSFIINNNRILKILRIESRRNGNPIKVIDIETNEEYLINQRLITKVYAELEDAQKVHAQLTSDVELHELENTSTIRYLDQLVDSDTKFSFEGKTLTVVINDHAIVDRFYMRLRLRNLLLDCGMDELEHKNISHYEYQLDDDMLFVFKTGDSTPFASVPMKFAYGETYTQALMDYLTRRNPNNKIN